VSGNELSPRAASKYIDQIHASCRKLPYVCDCVDIDVQSIEGQIYLAFHMRLDSGLSIGDVHKATEEMEHRLRQAFPALGRVVIHAEPCSSRES